MNIDHPTEDIRNTKSHLLDGKTICICLSGSVAVVNIPGLCREFIRHGAKVYAVMSDSAKKLIQPELLHWATGNPVITEITGDIEHIALAGARPECKGKSDIVIVAPATANTISKIACGIDDTPITTVVTTAFGSNTPIIIVPAMHESMYNHPILKKNIETLQGYGVDILVPRIQENKAKIMENEDIVSFVLTKLSNKKDLKNINFLVTAGPGREFIDRIRYITNPSSGKMGIEIVNEIIARGGNVTVILGRTATVKPPPNVETILVDTAEDYLKNVIDQLTKNKFDVFISAAAIPDFTPVKKYEEKISSSKNELKIDLKPTPKIIDAARQQCNDLFIVAFKAETNLNSEDLIQKAYKRMVDGKINMIVANDVYNNPQAGFQSNNNEVFIIQDNNGQIDVIHINLSSKRDIAGRIIDEVIKNKRIQAAKID